MPQLINKTKGVITTLNFDKESKWYMDSAQNLTDDLKHQLVKSVNGNHGLPKGNYEEYWKAISEKEAQRLIKVETKCAHQSFNRDRNNRIGLLLNSNLF